MPKLDTAGGFTKGDNVTMVNGRDVICSPGDSAEVVWCYEGDEGSGEWVYVKFPTPRWYHPTADPVTGYMKKGDPIYGPFAFRPADLARA